MKKLITILFLMACLGARAGWLDYPVPTNSVLSDATYTLLVAHLGDTNAYQFRLTNFQQRLSYSPQPGSPNLTNWSALATSAKQDYSLNLDGWSSLATSAKQDHSANLDLWNAVVPSSYQPLLGYLAMPASDNLTNWSAIATTSKQGHSLNLDDYSARGTNTFASTNIATASQNGLLSSTDWGAFNSKQGALGYTPQIHSLGLDALTNGNGASLTNMYNGAILSGTNFEVAFNGGTTNYYVLTNNGPHYFFTFKPGFGTVSFLIQPVNGSYVDLNYPYPIKFYSVASNNVGTNCTLSFDGWGATNFGKILGSLLEP